MRIYCLAFVFVIFLSGCGGEATQPAASTPTALVTPGTTITSVSTETLPRPATPGERPLASPSRLRLWLPPQFNPADDSVAGRLLQERLSEFSARRAGVVIDVRVKAVDGPGGLLDSLTTANAAASQALPDLVALPRNHLETAALKGLLHPFTSRSGLVDDPDWYEYARQMSRLQSSTFGLPFAGDALVLVYRPVNIKIPPADWAAVLQTPDVLAFPVADPQAIFTLAQYQAKGGTLRDDQGRPALDDGILTDVFTFYQEAATGVQIPDWMTQIQREDQAWDAFKSGRSNMVITWGTRYLSETITSTLMAPIPIPGQISFTLATGWVWALGASQPEHLDLAAQLAVFLTETDFLAEWTQAVHTFPPRRSVLQGWADVSLQAQAAPVLASARLAPSADVLTVLGPALQQATLQVIKRQSDPAAAAQDAVKSLLRP